MVGDGLVPVPDPGAEYRDSIINAGLDVEIAPNWALNLDVKWLYLRPDVAVETTVGRINATANIDPWIFGIGVRYRF